MGYLPEFPVDDLDALIHQSNVLLNSTPDGTEDRTYARHIQEQAQNFHARLLEVRADDSPLNNDLIHHLRSPLNIISAYTELLLDTGDTGGCKEALTRVRQLVTRLSGFLNRLT